MLVLHKGKKQTFVAVSCKCQTPVNVKTHKFIVHVYRVLFYCAGMYCYQLIN